MKRATNETGIENGGDDQHQEGEDVTK